jgi:hypothetical protein
VWESSNTSGIHNRKECTFGSIGNGTLDGTHCLIVAGNVNGCHPRVGTGPEDVANSVAWAPVGRRNGTDRAGAAGARASSSAVGFMYLPCPSCRPQEISSDFQDIPDQPHMARRRVPHVVVVLWQGYLVLFLKPCVGGSASTLGGAIGDMWAAFLKVQLEGISEVGCKPRVTVGVVSRGR